MVMPEPDPLLGVMPSAFPPPVSLSTLSYEVQPEMVQFFPPLSETWMPVFQLLCAVQEVTWTLATVM